MAYVQAQEYLKAETKKIFDRYADRDEVSEAMLLDILNTRAKDSDLNDLITLLRTVEDRQVRKQLQAYLSTLAAKSRITRLEMLRAKAYVATKQLADVQLRQETDFLTKVAQTAYKQAAAEAVLSKTDYDVKLNSPSAVPGARKLPNVMEFQNPDTGEVVKSITLQPEKPVKIFKHMSTQQTKAILDINWVGGNYSSRIWGNTDKLAKQLQELFTTQQLSGMSERDMMTALQKEFQVGAYEARRLIRTEANFVAGQAKLKGWRAHGVKQYVLIAVLDFRTSTICREKDGKVFNVADAHCNGPSGNYPPFHSFCRTVAAAYFGDETFVGKHQVNNPLGHSIELPAGTTWHEWEQALIDKYGKEAIEIEQMKATNYSSDAELFDRYSDLMPDDMPETFDDFQMMKYNDDRDWQMLQLDYERRIRLRRDPSLGLQNAEQATAADEKFTKYIFNPDNPRGYSKGKAFMSVLGYNADNYAELQSAILMKAKSFPTRIRSTDQYGDHIEQSMIIRGPNGHYANVKIGWTAKNDKTWMATPIIQMPKNGE
ncbi:minor capsid protein [Loigolactobacillus coryniformis]|uniref:minor capsid protein n=1 Tax=Loigolactobacillus coryniformis TaxID=1610 RepID=UPI003F1E8906